MFHSIYKNIFLITTLIFISSSINAQSDSVQNQKKVKAIFNFGIKIQSLNSTVSENPDFVYYLTRYPHEYFGVEIPPARKISNSSYILGIQCLDLTLGNMFINRASLGFDVMNYKFETSLYGLNVGLGRNGKILQRLSYHLMLNYHISMGQLDETVHTYSYDNETNVCLTITHDAEPHIPSLLEFNLGLNLKLGSKEKMSYPSISLFGGYNIVRSDIYFTSDQSTAPPGYVCIGLGCDRETYTVDENLMRYNVEMKNHFYIGLGLYYTFSKVIKN